MKAWFVSVNPERVQWFRSEIENLNGNAYDFDYATLASFEIKNLSAEEDVLFFDLTENPQDTNFKALNSLASKFSGQVVAVGSTKDSQEVLHALRSGACDYLETSRFSDDIQNIWKRLLKNAVDKPSRGKLVLVQSPNGGSGKSTVAANLAVIINQNFNMSVGLIDFDFDHGDIAGLLHLNPTFSVADIIKPNVNVDEEIFDRILTQFEKTGVHVLAAPSTINIDAVFHEDSIYKTLEMCRTKFPLTIVDMPGGFSEIGQKLIDKADLILVVHRLDYQSIRNTSRFLDFQVNDRKVPQRKFQLVLNRKGQPYEVDVKKTQEVLNSNLDWYLPNDPKAANLACNVGVPVVIDSPHSPLTLGFRKLAEKLIVRLNLNPKSEETNESQTQSKVPSFIASFLM